MPKQVQNGQNPQEGIFETLLKEILEVFWPRLSMEIVFL